MVVNEAYPQNENEDAEFIHIERLKGAA